MAYIRDRAEEKTGYQASSPLYGKIDFQCDFVMVYGTGPDMPERVRKYRENGYVVHLMTGIAWGGYQDYLFGRWDGRNHWDEAQTDRFGNQILHGKDTPYMVPTISFAEFITERLKIAVDAGVEAIHVEEPEFWDRGGYSEAFKREYLLYYKTPWVAPHLSADAHYKCARLKAYLYRRTIDRVSAAVKEYAYVQHGKLLRFYVPTHSLLNYTQWKIVSPEASLTEVAGVDGYIAQIWTGTSREKNVFEGIIRERTFETSYLEYGVMQELVKGTGRRMWFLHDPIEDMPTYDWNDYRQNYLKTVTASLLHPKINTYEICPWPNRVFDGKYPKNDPAAEPIPAEYASVLNNVFQTLGDMETGESTAAVRCGILISDTSLYQRSYPDGILENAARNEITTVMRDKEDEIDRFRNFLFCGDGDMADRLRFEITNMLPAFYGLCLPLLKYGMPVRPVLLDNLRRFNGYLDDYQVLVMSYEYCKPEYPDENAVLAAWVRDGGTLIYVGDGGDPFHGAEGFWTGKYPTAAHHLFTLLGLECPAAGESVIASVGKGHVGIWNTAPSAFCHSHETAGGWRNFFRQVIGCGGYVWEESNRITEQRGPYLAAAVFDENSDTSPMVLHGLYADMYTPDFAIRETVTLLPGENGLFFDLSKIAGETLRIIGTGARVFSMEQEGDTVRLQVRGADAVRIHMRLRTPFAVSADGVDVQCDPVSRTVLLAYDSVGENREIVLTKTMDW